MAVVQVALGNQIVPVLQWGGEGIISSISGVETTYSSGGRGGGGGGAVPVVQPNTGNGGSGAYMSAPPTNGSSGVVVVKYKFK